MKQNLPLATIKQLHEAHNFVFFKNLRANSCEHSSHAYMSQDGKFAWFWTRTKAPVHVYTVHVFSFETLAVYTNMQQPTRTDPTKHCKVCCEAYDRDKGFVNPTNVKVPCVPINNVILEAA